MKPTDADIETARLAVSLVLKHEEAAWTPVAELIAEHAVTVRRAALEHAAGLFVRDGNAEIFRNRIIKAIENT